MKESAQSLIKEKLPEFMKFKESDEGQGWYSEKEPRLKMTRDYLGPEKIKLLDEPTLEELMGSLWANRMWPNISVKMKMIMSNNTMSTLQEQLQNGLYGSVPLPSRYDDFRNSITHIGTAAVTELLAFVDPSKYPPWNERTRAAVKLLGITDEFPTHALKYSQISGADYEQCLTGLESILKILRENGFPQADFLDLHYFLAYVVEAHLEAETEDHIDTEYASIDEFNHDEIGELLALIGANLGFDATTKKKIVKGTILDVYWSARVGNMGEIAYAFEVQKSGSIDSLIVNLQRARNDPKVQRIVVVSTESGLQEVRSEIETLQGDFKRYLAYIDVTDVTRAAQLLNEVNELLRDLRLPTYGLEE